MKIIRLAALVAVLTVGTAAPAFAKGASVGHRVETLMVPGSAPGSDRAVKVHLWYPADERSVSEAPATEYTSALYGRELITRLDTRLGNPLAWKVEAEIARETDTIDPHGKPFPVIVFSHGATNDPIDYAHTLELIAAEGFVVAAPYHVNNTQDDARIDFINTEAVKATGSPLPLFSKCDDGLDWALSSPCSRGSVQFSMQERVRDISSILNALRGWFGDRVDAKRAGVMGHSRGTVTALAAAGGSKPDTWGIESEPRVKAIMGLAIGAPAITNMVDLAAVKVPAVLVAGGLDRNSMQAVSESAFAAIGSEDKLFVGIPNAVHRSFDSTYCAQLQSAGAAVDADHDGVVEADELPPKSPAILDLHTVRLIAASAPGGISGKAVHYCASQFFTNPVDIGALVASTANSEFPPDIGGTSVCLSRDIPCTGLETDEVKEGVTQIAVDFFDTALKRDDNDAIHFTGHLAPNWLMQHVPMVGKAYLCPPDQGVICAD